MARISARQYAQRIGVSGSYVSRLVRDGKLPVDGQGRIDPDEADRILAATREPARRANRIEPAPAPARPVPPAVSRPAPTGRAFAFGDTAMPGSSDLPTLLLKARTKTEVEKGRLLELKAKVEAGRFVDADEVKVAAFILAERVADSDDGELPLARRRPAGRGRARPDGEALGDADGPGREGRLPRLDRDAGEPPAWPPSPDDRDGWRRWLEREPGTEPALRRGAHGLAAGMVGGAPTNTDRIERLRLLGNGVVPLVAAHAFRTLRARLDADAGRRPG